MYFQIVAAILLLTLVSGCKDIGIDNRYTLYRTGIDFSSKVEDAGLRIHVATFDADEDAKYNLANCSHAEKMFNTHQPHYENSIFINVKLRYWCEKGAYKK